MAGLLLRTRSLCYFCIMMQYRKNVLYSGAASGHDLIFFLVI
uniref:Uncharacterized protein n=1 Tax=Anguilla anguilla TaxID=7936 RepID=A0A0E9VU04_ANGAN